MKKLMKKKVSLFGKEFSVFAIAVVSMMVMVSAALVPYLSGVVTGNVGVSSPITLVGASGDSSVVVLWADEQNVPNNADFNIDGSGNLLGATDIVGGDGVSFWIKATNGANQVAEGNIVFEILNNEGLTQTEVESIILNIEVFDWEHADYQATTTRYGVYTEALTYTLIDENTQRVSAPIWLWNATESDEKDSIYVKVTLDFPLNAIGTYDVDVAVLEESQALTASFPTA